MTSEGFDKEKYQKWKRLIPYLYDWFANHNLTWPSLTCRWGPLVEELTYKKKQRLYLSEQTDGTEPNKLLVVTADVCKSRVAAAENLSGFQELNKSPYIKPFKTILHPGEVNKIRECPQHPSVIVTHTDAPELYVWATDKQPNRAGDKGNDAKVESAADLVLEGHTDNAEFALGMCNVQPLVASGGKDTKVVIWSLADHITSLTGSSNGGKASRTLSPRYKLKGHEETVEDVCWAPGSPNELGSVGDDYALMFWDTRSGVAPVLRVAKAHGKHDLHCLDWSGKRPELVATGCANGSVKVWDKRMLPTDGKSKSLFTFTRHCEPIMRVEWCPHQAGVLASGGEDKLICIWNLDTPNAETPSGLPAQLMFQHAGHRAEVVEFQWNPHDPWTLVSVSDDVKANLGGGTLQLWRISDLIHRPEEEVLQELERFRDYIITGKERDTQRKPTRKQREATEAGGNAVVKEDVAKEDVAKEEGTKESVGDEKKEADTQPKETVPQKETKEHDKAEEGSMEVAEPSTKKVKTEEAVVEDADVAPAQEKATAEDAAKPQGEAAPSEAAADEALAPTPPPPSTAPPDATPSATPVPQQAVPVDNAGTSNEGTVDQMEGTGVVNEGTADDNPSSAAADEPTAEPMAVEQAAEDTNEQMDTDPAGGGEEGDAAMEEDVVITTEVVAAAGETAEPMDGDDS